MIKPPLWPSELTGLKTGSLAVVLEPKTDQAPAQVLVVKAAAVVPMAASGDRRGPDKAERQLNLVLALTDTKVGFSKAELLQAVHGYRQLWDAADTERARDSLDRMFERDKQDLKKLGVPIEAFEPYDESGNNKATRYCIERSLLEMPAGIVFSKSELEVLRAASFVWGQEHLATQSRLARAKLTSLGAGLSVGEVGIYPSMRLRDRSAAPLSVRDPRTKSSHV